MTSVAKNNLCLVCGLKMEKPPIGGVDPAYDCANCGEYCVRRQVKSLLEIWLKESEINRSKISYWIRRNQSEDKYLFTIDAKNYVEAIESITLPNVSEQADLLILAAGDEMKDRGPGHGMKMAPEARRAMLGALSDHGVVFLFKSLREAGLLELENLANEFGTHRLTFAGWRKYEELKRTNTQSTQAFMAMPYGDTTLEKLYREYYVPAVGETGFNLWRLDERPEAGLIDNNMLVAIRNSRFLVAEISSANPGAIWEAGYAEGEGKTVIYSCKNTDWERRHFDLRNRQTVRWSDENMAQAARDLKACILASFPGETTPQDMFSSTD